MCPEVETLHFMVQDRQLDPVNCPFGTVLEFLQSRFSAGLTHSNLKVYVVVIAAYHAHLGGLSTGKNPLVKPFFRCAEAESSRQRRLC